jgi:hypothetical protein
MVCKIKMPLQKGEHQCEACNAKFAYKQGKSVHKKLYCRVLHPKAPEAPKAPKAPKAPTAPKAATAINKNYEDVCVKSEVEHHKQADYMRVIRALLDLLLVSKFYGSDMADVVKQMKIDLKDQTDDTYRCLHDIARQVKDLSLLPESLVVDEDSPTRHQIRSLYKLCKADQVLPQVLPKWTELCDSVLELV